MRLLLLVAVVFFVISLVCCLVPTAVIGVTGMGWMVAGLLTWAIDVLVGGPVFNTGLRRTN